MPCHGSGDGRTSKWTARQHSSPMRIRVLCLRSLTRPDSNPTTCRRRGDFPGSTFSFFLRARTEGGSSSSVGDKPSSFGTPLLGLNGSFTYILDKMFPKSSLYWNLIVCWLIRDHLNPSLVHHTIIMLD